jgi:tryptophanase
MRYIPEPFKIKMVETVKILTEAERLEKIEEAFYNVFYLKSDDVYIDLLTDSGTGAMSDKQWAGMILGDEAYAGARGYHKLVSAVKDIFGYSYAQPVHQGRAAEQVLFPCLIKPGQKVISNMHFDTTRAHVELCKGVAIDLVNEQAMNISDYADFKGNMDTTALRKFILDNGKENIAMIIMTITNNSAGGQPVSISNIKETRKIADEFGITMIIDGARYAENAYFIKQREKEYKDKTIKEIVEIVFSYADAFTMSCKKDAIVNMGGLIGIKNNEDLYTKVKAFTVPYEGFVSYGGLAGRDLEALSIGLYEGIDYEFLKYRIGQIEYLGSKLKENGIPFQYPVGGHAVFIDAKAMLPQIPYYEFPAQALTLELYKEGGIRACDIGSFLMGVEPTSRKQIESKFEFCRLAIPRRVYTQAHLDYIVDCLVAIKSRANSVKGYKITWEPEVLRHFTAKLAPLNK